MISYARSPARLKPTWKGNLLLLLAAMLVSGSIWGYFDYKMTGFTRHGVPQQITANIVKLPYFIGMSRK